MRYFFVDIEIPADDIERAMRISDRIEVSAGPSDTGLGFGWRDMRIECKDELDQTVVVACVKRIFEDEGMPYTEGYENREERTAQVSASIVTRSSDPEEDEHDMRSAGLIPPGVQE